MSYDYMTGLGATTPTSTSSRTTTATGTVRYPYTMQQRTAASTDPRTQAMSTMSTRMPTTSTSRTAMSTMSARMPTASTTTRRTSTTSRTGTATSTRRTASTTGTKPTTRPTTGRPSTTRPTIPRGKVPIRSSDKAWFRRWLYKVDRKTYARAQAQDRTWSYADPNLLARFLNAKAQTSKGLRSSVHYRATKGRELDVAKRWVKAMMALWTRCDPAGAAAWATAPGNATILRLPKALDSSLGFFKAVRLVRLSTASAKFRDPAGKGSSMTGDTMYLNATKSVSCPDDELKKKIFLITDKKAQITGSKLMTAYLRAKNRQVAQTASTARQRVATQQNQLRQSRAAAQETKTRAETLAAEVSALQASLAETTAELDRMREQAALGMPVNNEALVALESEVTGLTEDLSEMHGEVNEAQNDADLAEEALVIEEDLFLEDPLVDQMVPGDLPADLPPEEYGPVDSFAQDALPIDETFLEPAPEQVIDEAEAIAEAEAAPTFIEQYKWHLLIAGVAAAGAFYYFKMYKPAQAAAPVRNLERRAALQALAENYDEDLY